MKEVYIIMSMDANGDTQVMRDAYTSQEFAMEAVERYRQDAKARKDGKIYYYSTITIVK